MTLLTLHRRAPVAPGPTNCQLCDLSIEGSYQDHLQLGPPGTAGVNGVICTRCGDRLSRMVGLYGRALSFLVQNERPSVSKPCRWSRRTLCGGARVCRQRGSPFTFSEASGRAPNTGSAPGKAKRRSTK